MLPDQEQVICNTRRKSINFGRVFRIPEELQTGDRR
jgi:hypothetical protein